MKKYILDIFEWGKSVIASLNNRAKRKNGGLKQSNGGPTHSEPREITMYNEFSDYLPWKHYDEETKMYTTLEDSLGFIWVCGRDNFEGESTFHSLQELLRTGLPDRSIIQFHLYDNRLIVAIKIPALDDKIPESSFNATEMYNNSVDSLRSAGLWPEPMEPGELVKWALRFLNDKEIPDGLGWDDTCPISKQVLFPDTTISDKKDHLIIGDRYFRCITPKKFPASMDPMKINELLGGIGDPWTDENHTKTPFVFTWSIFIDRKQEESKWATDQIRFGKKFVRVLPILWTWGTEQESRESISRIRRMWQGEGFLMQEDRGILKALFIAALPLGLIEKNKNIDNLERDFIFDEERAIMYAPIHADFKGSGAHNLAAVLATQQ